MSTTAASPPQVIERSGLLRVLVALACVVVAAIGLRISDPGDNFQVAKGVRDSPVAVNGGTVTVGTVLVGTAIEELGDRSHTKGLFVVVTVTAAATGSREVQLGSARLLSGDRVYGSWESASVTAAPGFASTQDFSFEVDPNRIDDLTIELWQAQILQGYHQRVRVHLGITPENAQQWRDAAQGQVLKPPTQVPTEALR